MKVSASREEFPEDKPKKTGNKDTSRSAGGAMKSIDSKLQLETDPQKSSDKRTNSAVPDIPYQFADPCPESMRDVNIADLSAVDINWKMLTLARPKTKVDEEIFSKLVQYYGST